jgi:hypothetical protein
MRSSTWTPTTTTTTRRRPPSPRRLPKPPVNLPRQDLTAPMLYDFLLGEIAAQRGSQGFAAQTYLDLAKRTRDRASRAARSR